MRWDRIPTPAEAYTIAESRGLLPFFDATLAKPEQNLLLAVAGGVRDPRELAGFRGAANRGRFREIMQNLIKKGRVIRRPDGGFAACGTLLACDARDIKKILKRGAVRLTLAMLDHPYRRLYIFGLSGMAAALNPAAAEYLDGRLPELSRTARRDQERSRRLKRGWLIAVGRRVPDIYLDPRGAYPRPAPPDIRERMLAMLLDGEMAEETRAELGWRIRHLYQCVAPRGERALAHWWRIAEEVLPAAVPAEERCKTMETLLASYLARVWKLPKRMRLQLEDRRELQIANPVPNCGYGPWIDDERRLWFTFRRRFKAVVGPLLHALWIFAHESTREWFESRGVAVRHDRYDESEYEEILFAVARNAIRPARPDTPRDFVREFAEYEERCELRTAIRFARDRPPGEKAAPAVSRRRLDDYFAGRRQIDLGDEAAENWAPRLLQLLVRRSMDAAVDPGELEHWERMKKVQLANRRRRKSIVPLEQHIRSALGECLLQRVPAGESYLPADRIAHAILGAVDKALQSAEIYDPDYAQIAHCVLEYLHRRQTVEVEVATGVWKAMTVLQAADVLSDRVGVRRLIDALGAFGQLPLEELCTLFGAAGPAIFGRLNRRRVGPNTARRDRRRRWRAVHVARKPSRASG